MPTTESYSVSETTTSDSLGPFHNVTCNITTSCSNNDSNEMNYLSKMKDLSDPFEAAMAFCQLVLCLVIAVVNTVTLIILATTASLKTAQNKYIVSLAGADQLVGTSLLNLLVRNYSARSQLFLSWRFNLAALYTAISVSLFSMLSISVDRYIYIVHPFFHMRHVTKKRTGLIILVQWTLAASYCCAPVFLFVEETPEVCNSFNAIGNQTDIIAYAHTVHFFIASLGIGVMYGLIAKVAKEHTDRRTKRMQGIAVVVKSQTGARDVPGGQTQNATPNGSVVPKSDVPKNVAAPENETTNPNNAGDPQDTDTVNVERVAQQNGELVSSELTREEGEKDSQIGNSQNGSVEVEKAENVSDGLFQEDAGQNYDVSKDCNHSSSDSTVQENKTNGQHHVSAAVKVATQNGDRRASGLAELQVSCTQTKPLSIASLRWMKQMVIVFGMFVICWTPCMACTLLSSVRELEDRTIYVLSMFGIANSAVNFFIYVLYNKQFRIAIKKTFCCCCCRHSSTYQ